MLEKKISSDDEVIRRYRKVGVVVFVVADDGNSPKLYVGSSLLTEESPGFSNCNA